MQKILAICFITVLTVLYPVSSFSQVRPDSMIVSSETVSPVITKKFNPRIATKRSAIIPGWGQAYNKKYWKIPLVYGALGTTAGIFVYNVKTYRKLKDAYANKRDGDDTNNNQIDPQFVNLSEESLRSYRNTFRQNVDYSVLFFLIFWGLNVVDATVDAHLKAFDVNDNLSLQLNPGYSSLANTTGLSLVLNIGKKNTR